MKKYLFFVFLLTGIYFVFSVKYTNLIEKRALYEKLGFTPHGKLYSALLGEFRWFMGDYLTFKSIMYYGGKFEQVKKEDYREIEFENLYRTLDTAVRLNPYHEDAYYFAQGVLTWDLGKVKEVNELLELSLKYRTWDYRLPFFLGFNHAYFFQDYITAATYMKKASEISNNYLFANIAAQFFHQGGKTDLGIVFLEIMSQHTDDENMKGIYQSRLLRLKNIRLLEDSVKNYKEKFHAYPRELKELVAAGIIDKIPDDPRRGLYYIDNEGKIRVRK